MRSRRWACCSEVSDGGGGLDEALSPACALALICCWRSLSFSPTCRWEEGWLKCLNPKWLPPPPFIRTNRHDCDKTEAGLIARRVGEIPCASLFVGDGTLALRKGECDDFEVFDRSDASARTLSFRCPASRQGR
jgi:hypothetical protein